jgi:hypothetical protein
VFSPGANQLAVATSGTGRLFVDASGRLLVGTSTSPSAGNGYASKFVVAGNAADINPESGAMSISRTGILFNSGDTIGSIAFTNPTGNAFAAISCDIDATPGVSDFPGRLTFSTTPDNSATLTERARIDSSGRLLVGTSSARQSRLGGSNFQTQFQIESEGTAGLATSRFNDAAGSSFVTLQKGRGTIASPAAVIDNDVTGTILFSGWDGAAFTNSALIRSEVDGTPGTDDMPGRLIFSTTADGDSGVTERMRIHSDGNVSIGSTSNTGDQLYVNGTIRSNGQIQTLIGDADTAPGYTWQGDEDTGMFRTGIDSLGFSAGGSEIARFNFGGTSGRRQLYFESTAEIWSGGTLYLEGVTSVRSVTIKDATTASAGNVFINSSTGLLQRSTSSVKYKTDVEDAELSYSEALVYGSRPVWYRSLSENDPSEYSYWGFIAEEVAEIDPRMVHWGDDGPEGVQYDRYVVHLVSVIQKQQQRLDVLEARIAALEA